MTNIVGEVLVNIKALVDPNQAKRDIGAGVTQGLKGVDQTVAKSLANVKQLQDTLAQLQTMRATAGQSSIPSIDKGIAQLTQELKAAEQPAKKLAEAQKAAAAESQNLARAADASAGSTRRQGDDMNVLSAKFGRARIAGVGLRSSYVGITAAAVIAAKGAQALGAALRVEGDAALTLSGRLRNVTSDVLTFNVAAAAAAAGEIAALQFQPGAREAQDAAQQAQARETELTRAIALAAEFVKVRAQAAKASGQVGTQEGAVKFQLQEQLRILRAQIKALPPGLNRVAFSGLGLGPNGARNQELIERTRPTRPTDQDFRIKTLQAAQTQTTRDDLALFQTREKFLRGLIDRAQKSGVDTNEAKANLVRLYGQLDSAESSIEQIRADNERKRAERLQAQIQLTQTNLQIAAANARTTGQEIAALQAQAAEASRLANDQRLTAQQRADAALEAAQINKQIFGINEQIRQEEERIAEQERKDREEKLKRQKEAAVQLRELRLSNAESRAALTKTTADDRKAIQNTIAYYKQIVKNTDGLTREQARTELISARSRLKALNGNESTGGATTADFFNAAIENFRTFGSNVAGRSGVLSGQDERGAFAGEALKRLGSAGTGLGAILGAGAGAGRASTLDTVVQTQRNTANAQLAETRLTNVLLRKIVGAPREPRIPKVTPKYTQDEATREATNIRGK